MNCKTCAENFTRLKDLIKHLTIKLHCHQRSNFFCIPCSLPLRQFTNVIEHIESEEHSILALATGIHFDAKDEIPKSLSAPFPAKDCCLLCSSRTGNPHHQHMKSATHSNAASLLRAIIKNKILNISDWNTGIRTQEFLNKMISVKQGLIGSASVVFRDPLPLVCELCNIYFNTPEPHKQHLENQSHKRMEDFMAKISHVVKEMVITGPCAEVSETFSNCLPQLYYCGFCFLWIEKTPSYVQHTQSAVHRRIAELSSKLSSKRNGYDVGLPLRARGSARNCQFNGTKHYCKLCTVWVSATTGYHQHHKDIGHKRIERFVYNLTSDEDKRFMEVYMEAEAHMIFNNTPPRNYCELCNILLSKSEKYELHLQSEGHKHVEKNYPQDKSTGGNASKRLKASPSSPRHHLVGKYGPNTHTKEKEVSCGAGEANSTNSSFQPPHFEDVEIHGNSPREGFEDRGADGDSDQEYFCELCEIVCYNPVHYSKHLMGEEHKKMRRMLSKKGKGICSETNGSDISSSSSHPLQYNCELCDVLNRDYQEYEFHLITPKHKRNQWLLYVFKQKCL